MLNSSLSKFFTIPKDKSVFQLIICALRFVIRWVGGAILLTFAMFMVWYYAFVIHPSPNQLNLMNPFTQPILFQGSVKDAGSPDLYTVYAHGIGPKLQDGRVFLSDGTATANNFIGAKELAKVIRSYGWDGKMPINLIVCRVGDLKVGLASDLSKELGVPVYSTDKYYYISTKRVLGAYNRKQDSVDNRDENKPANIYKFLPDGSHTIANTANLGIFR